MKLIADSGSTKTDWLLKDNNGQVIIRFNTEGINPIHLTEEEVNKRLSTLVGICPDIVSTETIEYYGTGCNAVGSKRIVSVLREIFGDRTNIIVDSDIVGAAKALFADGEGIACILGTGANSCHWQGSRDSDGNVSGHIISQTPALGYILGDEGSGAVLGKNLINALYKNVLSDVLRQEFEHVYNTSMMDVIERVYRQPAPNTWLASLSPFIYDHLDIPEVEALVIDNFRLFFQRNIVQYHRPDLTVSFVGSIASIYKTQLEEASAEFKIKIGDIIKSPIEKL